MIQQPTVAELAYLAGFVDGEGCLTLKRHRSGNGLSNRYVPTLHISQKDPAPLVWAQERFGGTLRQLHRPHWRWYVRNQACLDLVKALEPYLVLKHAQAVELLKVKLRGGPGQPRNYDYTPPEERLMIKQRLSELKRLPA